jgi:hypothetical protein
MAELKVPDGVDEPGVAWARATILVPGGEDLNNQFLPKISNSKEGYCSIYL